MMSATCMVLCGVWRCPKKLLWEFCPDTKRLSRIINIEECCSLANLQKSVLKEFGLNEGCNWMLSLSYWPFSVEGFANETMTPPVMLTNDAAVAFFKSELAAGNAKNLFVTIDEEIIKLVDGNNSLNVGKNSLNIGQKSVYKTPLCKTRRQIDFDLNIEASLTDGTQTTTEIPTVDSLGYTDIDDEDIISFIADEEERGRSGSVKSKPSRSAFDLGIETDESDDDIEIEDVVHTPGFDREFWEPLLNEDMGGSNAVDLMCDDVEENIGANRNVLVTNTVSVPNETAPNKNNERRVLSEIDNEEFDIPPMFDDTEYEAADIPDLDRFDDDHTIARGKVYGCREDLQISLAIFAIKNMFHFIQSRTTIDYVVFSCSDSKCDWRVTAREMKDCGYYKVKKAYLEHTCSIETRNRFGEKATSRIIAAVYKAKYGNPVSGPVAMDLQQLVLEDLRVPTSYMKCWRAKERAISGIWGTDEDSYLKLPLYLHLLKLSNPGTVTELVTETVESTERFKYLFLSFGASIEGFKMLRRVLVVDGTHLSGRYKGVLLTASGQDANFQVFPLAYAIVDSENDDAWTWFMQSVEKIVGDSQDMTIISDRCQSIYKAISVAFPKSKHAACVVHLQRNVTSRFKSKGLAKLVGKAAFAYKIGEFNELFNEIKKRNIGCAKYLETIKIKHWARAYFDGERYNLMTSNIAETLNKALKKGRASPIVELLRFIQSMMTRWFAARRQKIIKHRGEIPTEVEKVLVDNKRNFVGSTVNKVSMWSYEVVGLFGSRTQVFLDDRKCGCRKYDCLQIPCGHALIAADTAGLSYSSLLPLVFKKSSWVATYKGVINPAVDEDNVTIPDNLVNEIRPPKTRRPSGRPKTARIASEGEIGYRPSGSRSIQNKCGRCRRVGHNRVSCKEPI